MFCEGVILSESRLVGMSCIKSKQKYVEVMLFQYSKFFANFDKGCDGFVQVFFFVGGG